MNTLLLTIIFLVNVLSVSNDSSSEFEYLIGNSKKYNTISYDKIAQDSQSKLLKILKIISKNQNRMVLSIDVLIYFIDNEVISLKQSELIWSYMVLKSEQLDIQENIRISPTILKDNNVEPPWPKEESYVSLNKTIIFQNEEKKSFSFYQLMILILIGYIIGIFLVIIIFVALYQREAYILLCFASVFLSYNLLNYARVMKDQMKADFLPSLFFNSSLCLTNLVIHLILIKLRIQKKFLKWTDIFAVDATFKGKYIHSLFNILMSYNLAFYCKSGFIQIPFIFSIYYSVYLVSSKLENYFSKRLWPSWLFSLSVLAFFITHYIYRFEEKSFIFLTPRYSESIPNFQFVGYFFSVMILNTLFPVYLYIQHQKLWMIYQTPEFSYKLVFKKFRQEISQDVLIFDSKMIYYYIYAIVIVGLIFLGLKLKMVLMVVIPSFALQSYMGFIVKDERLFWIFFFYLGSLYVLNSVYLIGKMDDKLSVSVFFFRNHFFLILIFLDCW